MNFKRRQDFSNLKIPSGHIYLTKLENIKGGFILDSSPGYISVNDIYESNIDTLHDLDNARLKCNKFQLRGECI